MVYARFVAGCGIIVAACSVLVHFDEQACEGGACIDSSTPDTFVVVDAGADIEAEATTPDASRSCKGKLDGFYCGNNGISPPLPPEYLVHCVDGGAALTLCQNGCLAFPVGFPDKCDKCYLMKDGLYCGKDFNYGVDDNDFLIRCSLSQAIIQKDCTLGCASNGIGDASCK